MPSNPKPYEPAEATEEEPAEQSPFARLVESCKRLQVIFLRASGLQDNDLKQICNVLKPDYGEGHNKTLKVLDVSYNNFSGAAI